MGSAFQIAIPWPPTVNTYWRRHGNVIHLSQRGRSYGEQVARIVRADWPYRQLTERLGVLIELWPPNRRVWDVDNRAKAVLDALTKARVWLDDSQVRELRIVDRVLIVKGGQCRVTIWQLEG
jgi:crossover junction endodeoxyribonuclease RusA